MLDISKIRQGMEVYNGNQLLGKIEQIKGQNVMVKGQTIPLSAFTRMDQNKLYIEQGGAVQANLQEGEAMKVAVHEEQLNVGKRQVELGEVQVHKTVTQEQVNVPIELRKEEVHVEQMQVTNRPLQAGEVANAFQEGTITIPVRGEEAVVAKQAVVTGEVVINKDVMAEQQTISDSVRKEHVTVDNNVERSRGQVVAQPQLQPQVVETRTQTEVDPTMYNQTATTGGYTQAQLQEDMPVYSSDGHHLGKIKEFRDTDFLLGRGIFKGDLEADYSSIGNIENGEVVLNFSQDQINEMS